jgi:hypothetical protein
MTCEQAGHLLDDYVDGALSQRDRQFLEAHLERCGRCAEELRQRPAFERCLRRALAKSVQPLALTVDASSKIIDAAEDSLRRAQRSRRVTLTIHLLSAVVIVSLLAVGVLFILGEIPVPDHLKRVTLLPVKRLALAEAQDGALSAEDPSLSRLTESSQQSLPRVSLLIEPRDMRPAQPFTMTVLLHSELAQPLDSLRLDLDVSGPTGYYNFGLTVPGPLPAHGVSILRLTPELLAESCKDRYLIAPTEVFRFPGTYNIRLTLFDAVAASQ